MSIILGSEGELVASPEQTRLFDSWSLPIMLLDAEQRFVYANRAYLAATHKELDDVLGRYIFDAFPDSEARVETVRAKFQHTLDTGETTVLDHQPFQLEFEDGTVRDLVWEAVQDPVRNAAGQIVGLIQRAEDVTKQVELMERNRAIGFELNHRVKNIMAVVMSVARITSRNANNVQDFTADFIERLTSISRTNDQLARDEWRGLTVRDVLDGALLPYREEQSRTYMLEGPEVRLSLDATKDLSMVVHELATNAAKYGCLGDEKGALDVRWRREGNTLTVAWDETCSHPVTEPQDDGKGFGTRLLDMLPYITAKRDFRDTGLHLTVTVEGADAFA